MPYRSPARFLAPLAVLIAAGAVYLIVQSGLQESTGSPATTATTRTTTTAKKRTPSTKSTYTVRPGDSLGAISDRLGIPLERLEELNPTLDANQLRPGQKLKIRAKSS